jgi:hypothetical protein
MLSAVPLPDAAVMPCFAESLAAPVALRTALLAALFLPLLSAPGQAGGLEARLGMKDLNSRTMETITDGFRELHQEGSSRSSWSGETSSENVHQELKLSLDADPTFKDLELRLTGGSISTLMRAEGEDRNSRDALVREHYTGTTTVEERTIENSTFGGTF